MSHEYKKEIMRKCLGIFGEIYLQRDKVPILLMSFRSVTARCFISYFHSKEEKGKDVSFQSYYKYY
jgi:hypothetical protein